MELVARGASGLLPLVSAAVLVVGLAWRILAWARLPQRRITVFRGPGRQSAPLLGVLKATLFFPSLMRTDRVLWGAAWIFHASLAVVLLGHVRVATDVPTLWRAIGIDPDALARVVGTVAGVLLVGSTVVLLARRIFVPHVRQVTEAGDYVSLLLLLGIILTGTAMRLAGGTDLAVTRAYFAEVAHLREPAPLPGGLLVAHALLAQALCIYFPFSKLLHSGGVFFTQAALQRR